MVVGRVVPGDSPFHDGEVRLVPIYRWEQPVADGLQHQDRHPLVSQSLRPFAAFGESQDHPLEMVVGLAEIMDSRREKHDSPESFQMLRGVQT